MIHINSQALHIASDLVQAPVNPVSSDLVAYTLQIYDVAMRIQAHLSLRLLL